LVLTCGSNQLTDSMRDVDSWFFPLSVLIVRVWRIGCLVSCVEFNWILMTIFAVAQDRSRLLLTAGNNKHQVHIFYFVLCIPEFLLILWNEITYTYTWLTCFRGYVWYTWDIEKRILHFYCKIEMYEVMDIYLLLLHIVNIKK